jgi:hypothetical protein
MRASCPLAIVLLIISTYAVSTLAQERAEVRYTCNTNIGAIEIHLSEFDKCLEGYRALWAGMVVPWEQDQKIETVQDAYFGERHFRIPGEPVRYECDLKSGKYVVTFGAHWVNSNLAGQDTDIWPKVEITRGTETILPTTVLGKCQTRRAMVGNCRDVWAIRVFLIHSGGIPYVTIDRFVEDWARPLGR